MKAPRITESATIGMIGSIGNRRGPDQDSDGDDDVQNDDVTTTTE